MAYQFMYQHQGQYAITKMARELWVSRSGYYAWLQRKPGQHESEDRELLELIIEIFNAHYRRYGSPRVWEELKNTHQRHIGRKRVARLMREHGLQARRRRKFAVTTDLSHTLAVATNILNRDFFAAGPGEKWVSDITYLRTSSGWLYLTTILDLWDRKVIGWAFSDDMAACHVSRALEMALSNRAPKTD
ncbi:IS3 family transposase [Treponema primitia]|uniref:IS3 family transposase n=1 Tax=Treponema primitia TaxID=88058 RepID=UPI00397F8A48